MKIACSVVTYHPTKEQLDRIGEIKKFLPVFVVDNTKENRGIAWALNEAAIEAIKAGYRWMLTLDQDANLTEEQWNAYLSEFERIDTREVAAVVPVVDPREELGEGTEDVLTAMTSGMIINLLAWERTGGFESRLFIDEVDTEYCLRVKLCGYRVVKLKSVSIPHQPGKAITINTKWGERLVAYHPPKRIYYIVRNYWFLKDLYAHHFPDYLAEKRRNVIQKHKEYLKYHPRKLVSLYHLLRGTFHGMIGRFGR